MAEIKTRPADLETIIDLFSKMTTVSAVSLKEKPVAVAIKEFAQNTAFECHEDEAGQEQGNLIFVPKNFDNSLPSVAFFAHMDTARNTGNTRVVRTEDRITSDGTSQLGADNRLGVSLLMYAMRHAVQPSKCNLLYVFTVAEEIGMVGANALDLSPWNVSTGYVFDSSLRPGKYIAECGGMYLFQICCRGKAAHSAVNPDDGISAIMMAGEIITHMRSLVLPEDTTMNIGTISGGEGSNIIPEETILDGEVRGFSPEAITTVLSKIEHICADVSADFSSPVECSAEVDFQPYMVSEDSVVRQNLEESIRLAGLVPNGVRYKGGSDANALHAKGIPAINIGIGAQKPHANEEFVLIEDIQSAGNIIISLLNVLNKP